MSDTAKRYLAIDTTTWDVTLTEDIPASGIVVPTERNWQILEHPELSQLLYYRVLYPSVREADKKEGLNAPRKDAVASSTFRDPTTGKVRREYALEVPDPWMIAVAMVMWEGIIQGFTWDVIKAGFNRVLDNLRGLGLAPPRPSRTQKTSNTGKLELGFHWIEYASSGKKQREMFLGLRGMYKRVSERARIEITESMQPNGVKKQRDKKALPKSDMDSDSWPPTREQLERRVNLDKYEELPQDIRKMMNDLFIDQSMAMYEKIAKSMDITKEDET